MIDRQHNLHGRGTTRLEIRLMIAALLLVLLALLPKGVGGQEVVRVSLEGVVEQADNCSLKG